MYKEIGETFEYNGLKFRVAKHLVILITLNSIVEF